MVRPPRQPGQPTPEDPVDAAVADVSAAVLGPATAPSGATFVELGGTSLTAIELADGLTTQLGVEIPPELVIDADDLRDLSRRITEQLAADPGAGR